MSVLSPHLDQLRLQFSMTADDETAWLIIDEYFRCFHSEEIQEELWLLKINTFIDNNSQPAGLESEKEDLIFFVDFTMLVMEAYHFLYARYKRINFDEE